MKDGFARLVDWLEPWVPTGADAVNLEDELHRELGPATLFTVSPQPPSPVASMTMMCSSS